MGRPRDRRSGEGLLPNMEARPWSDGKTITYRFKPLGSKKWENLGTNKQAALREVLDRAGQTDNYGTLEWVWNKYTDEQRPAPRWKKLANGTQDDYRLAWKQIRKTFGKVMANRITPSMVARYVHIERAESPRRADIEKALLSNLFGYGIKLGVCEVNATIGVEPHGSEASTVLPDADVLSGFLAWLDQQTPQRRIIGMMAEYASLAGNRRVEFLDLTWPQVDMVDGEPAVGGNVRVKRAKQRGKKRGEVIELIEITPALADLLKRLRALNRDCLYVFPTRDNNAYTDRGFKTLWQRAIKVAMAEKVLTKGTRFTFHSLRAHYATVHKRDRGALPDMHANPAVTARVYDRSKEVKRRAL